MTIINEVRELFELKIESAADWRNRKAEEYPDDSRNAASAKALKALLEYLPGVSDDHSIFHSLAYYSETDLEETLEAVEIENNMLSRYGFDGEEDPESFLNDLAAEIRKALQARPRPV